MKEKLENVFGVEKIIDIKVQKETTFYKVQWADSWEPEYNLLDCKELIDEFLEQQKHEKTKSIDEEKQEEPIKYDKTEPRKKRKGHGWSAKRTNIKKRKSNNQSGASAEEPEDASPDDATPEKEDINATSSFEVPINTTCSFEVPTTSVTTTITSAPASEEHVAVDVKIEKTDSDDTNTTTPTLTCDLSGTCTSSTTTTTHTPTTAACSDPLWARKNVRASPISVGDDSDEEKESKVEEEEPANVKIKEEPISEGEDEEPLFKRTAKLKASFVIRRLCETGEVLSDEEDPDFETFRPDPRLNDPVVLTNDDDDDDGSSAEPLVLSINNTNSSPASINNKTINPSSSLPPLTQNPAVSQEFVHRTPLSTQYVPRFVNMRMNNANNSPFQSNVPIKYLPNHYIEMMLSRILWHVKESIQALSLEISSLKPELIELLIRKSVVLTAEESYNFEKCEPNFLETQINDLAKIALREFPCTKLLHWLSNTLSTPSTATPGASSPQLVSNSAATSVSTLGTPQMTVRSHIDPNIRNFVPVMVGDTSLSIRSPPIRMLNQLSFRSPSSFVHRPVRVVPPPQYLDPVTRVPFSYTFPPVDTARFVNPRYHHIPRIPVNNPPRTIFSTPDSVKHSEIRHSDKSKTNSTNVAGPSSISPPSLSIINSMNSIPSLDSSLLCNITNVRSLKTTNEPTVVCLDDNDDDEIVVSKTSNVTHATETNKKVKTVLGPHRFYKPPVKNLDHKNEASPGVKQKLSLKQKGQVRYKDLVNQKFAIQSAVTSDAVVDLTDADPVVPIEISTDETKDQSKEKSEEKLKEKSDDKPKEKLKDRLKEKLEDKLKDKLKNEIIKERLENKIKEKLEDEMMKGKLQEAFKEKIEHKSKEKVEDKIMKETLEEEFKEKSEDKSKENSSEEFKEKVEDKLNKQSEDNSKKNTEEITDDKCEEKNTEKLLEENCEGKLEELKCVEEFQSVDE